MTSPLIASAPGKLMIAGEYAVLDGSPAVVTAASRRLSVRLTPSAEDGDGPPEVMACLELCRKHFQSEEHFHIQLDAEALRSGEQKLGLGSSAAAAASTTAALFHHHGLDIQEPATQAEVFRVADAGHRSIAPRGSGADVCAAVFGGWREFIRQDGVSRSEQLKAPTRLEARVIWTGVPVRTSEMVDKVRTLKSFERGVYQRRREAIDEATEAFLRAFNEGNLDDLVRAVSMHHDALAALGRDSGAPIVDPTLSEIALLAEEAGGAAKGSGAGGGDVAIAFFTHEEAANAFCTQCEARGYAALDLILGADGVLAGAS